MAGGVNLGSAYVQVVPSAQGIQGSLTKVLGGEAEAAGKSAGSKVSGALGGVLKAGIAGATAAIGAASAAVGKFTTSAVKNFADYEQLVGGVETLFGAGGQSIEEYAQSVGTHL